MKNHYPQHPIRPGFSFRLGKLLLAALFVCSAFSLHAQTTWTGATNADWNTATNWSAGIPDATDDVSIPNVTPKPAPVLSTSAVAKSVVVNSGASLSLTAVGSLTINGSSGIGLLNNGGGSVDNSGAIVIGNTSAVVRDGILSGGQFTNQIDATIHINRTGGFGGVNNSGTFSNAGRITIGDVALSSQDDIENYATFTNTATGEIKVDRGGGNGIWNIAGTFQNDGKIIVGSVANTGTGILNTATSFTNSAGASIQLDRVSRGLTNTSTFTNAGQIRMGNNAPLNGSGLLNGTGSGTPAAVMNNLAGGSIQIDQTAAGQDGITNDVNTTFTNAGTVRIGTMGSIGGDGIENAGTFANNACATLTVFDNINNSNSFTNAGLFTVKTTQAHTNSALTNNGIIEYPLGNPIPNVTNNDLTVAPVTGCSPSVSPALQVDGANSFTAATTWYKDANLTMTAGTYDQQSNTFTATNLAPGTTATLYFKATDNVNSCTDTVSIAVTLNALPTLTPGPNQSVIFGFGSNCTDISATADGTGPFTYTWSGSSGTTGTVNVCPQTTTIYTVTVTDGNGCQATDEVTITVKDVRCGPGKKNVSICYYGVTQCVSEKIAARYLKLGATLGGCGTGNARIGVEESSELPLTLSLKAYPNPVQDAVTVEVLSRVAGVATFEVLDVTGHTRQSRKQELVEGLNKVEFRLGSLPTGIYLIRAIDALNQQGVVRVSKQ